VYASSNGYGGPGIRGDCGHVLSTASSLNSPSSSVSSASLVGKVSGCPGSLGVEEGGNGNSACSGHGVCDMTSYRCYCQNGWQGGDCSLQTCPKGLSWFSYPSADNVAHDKYTTCSDM